MHRIPIVAASGKLDKAALPHIDRTQAIDADGQPSTPTEQQMATLWADVLDLRAVDVHESFFDLGGWVRGGFVCNMCDVMATTHFC